VGAEQAGDPSLLRQELRLEDAQARVTSVRDFIRLSFAEQPSTLELAVERLAAAWELHAETLAASPSRG
jgi:hypothetical protein